MGFGTLLIGYTLSFAFALSPYYFFADIFGGLVMAYAFVKLSAFHLKFRPAGVTSILYSAVSLLSMLRRLNFFTFSDIGAKAIEAGVAGCILVLHFFMFYGIIALTSEIELPKIATKAKRNLIVLILYYTLYTLTLLAFNRLSELYPQAAALSANFFTLFQLFWLLLNIILIGSCCKWIGIEGEDAPKENPTKLDKLSEKWSEAEKKIFTPKEKRNNEESFDVKQVSSSPNKKKRKKKK